MIKVLQAPFDKDLAPFTKQLWALRITHRVVFEEQQVLIVDNPAHAEFVLQIYNYWQQTGEFPVLQVQSEQMQSEQTQRNASPGAEHSEPIDQTSINQAISHQNSHNPVKQKSQRYRQQIAIARTPLVIVLLLLSLALSLLTNFGADYHLLAYFTVTDFQVNGSQVNYYNLEHNFETMELWRFISPIFVHFNLPHIVFNSLWIWVVGRVIESQQSTWVLLFIALSSALASNLAQYYQTGPVFGGLSGVVYAVISYAWLWDKLTKPKLNIVSNGLMGFMIVWLALGYSGVLSSLGLGQIANTAHLAGLISGLAAVIIVRAFRKVQS